ncbi:uncharacterized protein [Oryza sativa Japonica Group]|uniref:uncharacterized protein n=1 Tax=Oryza sativa subsp. japonica TaxID=39947 RepID=UPI00339D11F3
MPPPIAGNGRAKSGRLPLPPAGFSAAVPTSPPRSRRRPPLSFAPATSSRLPLLAGASSGRAVASLGSATPSPSPASPSPRRKLAGTVPPPATSGIGATVLPPAGCCSSPVRRSTPPSPPSTPRHRLLPRHHLLLARISPERRRPRRPLLPPRRHLLRLPLSPCPCISRRCRPLPRHGDVALHLVHSSVSPERHRREPLHPPRRSCSAARPSSPVHRSATPPSSSASQPRRRPRPRLPSDRTPPVSVVVFTVPSRRLVVSRRRLRHRHHSGVFHVILVPVQPLPAVLVASSPAPVVVALVLSSFPIVVAFVPPSSRSRPSSAFVKRVAAAPSSCSSSAPRRQASCRPRLAFAQGSPPKPSPRRSSPLCPSVSAAPVRRCRSHASSRGGL